MDAVLNVLFIAAGIVSVLYSMTIVGRIQRRAWDRAKASAPDRARTAADADRARRPGNF